jgi:hypothetical protein
MRFLSGSTTRPAAIACLLISIGYAILGLAVLEPDAIYSGDIGVKYVQARALAASGFESLDLDYPGSTLDPRRDFFPIRPPFVITVTGVPQAIFSPAAAIVQSALVSAGGLRGLIAGSIFAGALVLLASMAMSAPRDRLLLVIALGVGSPVWFYAVSGWEHAPAIALSTTAFAIALRAQSTGTWLVAGALLGIGIVLRDEVLLLTPGLVLIAGVRTRSLLRTAILLIGLAVPFAIAIAIEVDWYGRPAASHLRHAIYLEGADLPMTGAGGVPAVQRLALQERYETVIQYWLLGYGQNLWILIGAVTCIAALLLRRVRSEWGSWCLFVWLACILVLAVVDAREVISSPKWLAGLHRVSPFLVFALLPRPSGERRDWFHRTVLLTAVIFVTVAFATTNTTGGKSLGPRLLLPLLPLLAVVAIARIREYNTADVALHQWIGRIGIALVLLAVLAHPFGMLPAYLERNRVDASAIVAARAAAPAVVIADDAFTAHFLLPLYYRKTIFLADTHKLGAMLGAQLAAAKVSQVLVISRRAQPATSLPPFYVQQVSRVGRVIIQHWGRRPAMASDP